MARTSLVGTVSTVMTGNQGRSLTAQTHCSGFAVRYTHWPLFRGDIGSSEVVQTCTTTRTSTTVTPLLLYNHQSSHGSTFPASIYKTSLHSAPRHRLGYNRAPAQKWNIPLDSTLRCRSLSTTRTLQADRTDRLAVCSPERDKIDIHQASETYFARSLALTTGRLNPASSTY